VSFALLVAHPGHELRLHGWIEREKPLVYVLTDGSGRGPAGRIESTRQLLAAAGARPGPVFGKLKDAELYRALLWGDHRPFVELFDEIAGSSRREGVKVLAADAAEGYNPAHDVARLLANAVAGHSARAGFPVESLAFPLEAAPAAGTGAVAVRLALDDLAFARKLAAARAYGAMSEEVERALARHGEDAFRVETLRRADPGFDLEAAHGPSPSYERFGERRVADGAYPEVVRFRAHLQPLAARLEALAARG
jgi:hypothetical protein